MSTGSAQRVLPTAWAVSLVVLAGVMASASWRVQAAGGTQNNVDASVLQVRVIDQYCATCHNDRLRTAGLSLDVPTAANVAQRPEVWEKVVRKVRLGAMPPPGVPGPDKSTAAAFVLALQGCLDRAAELDPNVGRVETFHRLNRAEYQNVIRDLLAIDIDAKTLLPPDDISKDGFDNVASTLSIPPSLLERYVSAAKKISRLAVGIAPPGPTLDTARGIVYELADEWLNANEELPFGSRGGLVMRPNLPVAGEYGINIRLRRSQYDYIMGLGEAHELQVRLDGALLKSFTVGGEAPGTPAPFSFAGNLSGDPDWEQYVLRLDERLNFRFHAPGGPHIISVSFVARPTIPEGVQQRRQPNETVTSILGTNFDDPFGNPAVETVSIDGPHSVTGPSETPSRRRLLVCRPVTPKEEVPCARKILSHVARRAYRRPVTSSDIDVLLEFYREGREDDGFDAGIAFALERLLVDPNFLIRIERDPSAALSKTAYRLSDLELASRLSFFLWSSIPDDALLDLAEQSKLHQPGTLARQARRMLADPRSRALVENFVGQWLQLRNIGRVTPDARQFPDFDETLRQALRLETELFVGSTVAEDRSVVDLLRANYSFINERLARHYRIPGIHGNNFRRVTFSSDAQRGGLLGHASLLTVTSYPNRTSPVLRGKWLLENLLGSPPPPPPPNVPGLPDKGAEGKPASVRERLEQHRKNAVCATCHRIMDPLGFALENFDAVGKWRAVNEVGAPVDAKGAFVNGGEFEGLAGLRAFLLSNREAFVETVIEKLLAYGLGRELEAHDLPVVRRIRRQAAATDYRWSSIIEGIVTSPPFVMRMSK